MRRLHSHLHTPLTPLSGDDAAAQKFVEIADAYEILSEPETRRIFDQHGHEGIKRHKESGGRGGGGHHDPFDLFSRFFGGGGHAGHQERRGPNMEIRVNIALRDFYNGVESEFMIEKQMICETCSGSGSADGQRVQCGGCGGRGQTVQRIQFAPGIFQQVQSPCNQCGGQGTAIKTPCKVCGGARVVRGQDTHTLVVERGMPKGTRIQYENEADESPDFVAGDLIVHLAELEAAIGKNEKERTDGTFFRRRGKDLIWREVLSLREAWMGDWTRNITHLDGHIVQLSRKRGVVVQPNMVEVVPNEGMPIYHEQREMYGEAEFGDLLVEYTVVLPDQMDASMEKEFFGVWDKYRKKGGIDLGKDSGRPVKGPHDEL